MAIELQVMTESVPPSDHHCRAARSQDLPNNNSQYSSAVS